MNDNTFDYQTAHADGSTVYAAAHEATNEIQIKFPPGYWNESPPSKIEVDLNVGMKSTQQREEFNWRVAPNRHNHTGSGDKPAFEIYNVSPPIYHQMEGLTFTDNSNWAWPWSLKVVGGRIGVTHAQMSNIMEQFARITKPRDR